MEVGKDAGEKVPIVLPIIAPNHHIVYGDLSVLWWIKPRKYFEEGRFSASVTASDKNQFASGKLEIERLQGERWLAAFISIAEDDSRAVETLEGKRRTICRQWIRQTFLINRIKTSFDTLN